MRLLGKVLLVVGIALLVHALNDSLNYRRQLKIVEKPFTMLPITIIAEALASLMLLTSSVIFITKKFLPIRVTHIAATKSWDIINSRSSFVTFNHRRNSAYQ